jgi:hypothetical protein
VLPPRRIAVPPESLPLVPLAAFRQLKPGLRCHQTSPTPPHQRRPHQPRAVAHGGHLRACARQSAAAPRDQLGRQLAPADSRVAVLGAAIGGRSRSRQQLAGAGGYGYGYGAMLRNPI